MKRILIAAALAVAAIGSAQAQGGSAFADFVRINTPICQQAAQYAQEGQQAQRAGDELFFGKPRSVEIAAGLDPFMTQMMRNAAAYGFAHPHDDPNAAGAAAVGECVASVKSYAADAVPLAQRLKDTRHLEVGMTKDQVRASMGNPCGPCYGTTHNSWGDTWEYNAFGTGSQGIGNGTIVYFDAGGKVTGWSSP